MSQGVDDPHEFMLSVVEVGGRVARGVGMRDLVAQGRVRVGLCVAIRISDARDAPVRVTGKGDARSGGVGDSRSADGDLVAVRVSHALDAVGTSHDDLLPVELRVEEAVGMEGAQGRVVDQCDRPRLRVDDQKVRVVEAGERPQGSRSWNEGRLEGREGDKDGGTGSDDEVEGPDVTVWERDADEMVAARNQSVAQPLTDHLPARARNATFREAERLQAQAPTGTEISGSFVPTVVGPDHLDRNARQADGEIGVGDGEMADLHRSLEDDLELSRRGVPVGVVDLQLERVGTVQQERRVQGPEEAVRDLCRPLSDQREARVARGRQGQFVAEEMCVRGAPEPVTVPPLAGWVINAIGRTESPELRAETARLAWPARPPTVAVTRVVPTVAA